jgi:hypothetical protein
VPTVAKNTDPLQAESDALVAAIGEDLARLLSALPENPTRERAAALVQLGKLADTARKLADRAWRKAT